MERRGNKEANSPMVVEDKEVVAAGKRKKAEDKEEAEGKEVVDEEGKEVVVGMSSVAQGTCSVGLS
jgi:predicted amidohydrolase YtcJ